MRNMRKSQTMEGEEKDRERRQMFEKMCRLKARRIWPRKEGR